MRLVLIYLGNRVPKYVLKNYNLIRSNFPKNEVWLVVDSEKHFDKMSKSEILVWLAPKISSYGENHNTYRNNFWIETRNRFFALEEFHKSFSDQSLLHIESDVIIFPEFPMNDIDNIHKSIAYPMSSPDVGIASVLYCKTVEATKFFSEFAFQEINDNPRVTDTEILGSFYKNYSDKALILRSGPDHFEAYNYHNDGVNKSLSGEKSEINNFGIFDASTLGIHLCGTDPRNQFGISSVINPLNHHFLNVSRCKFEVINDHIYVTCGNETRVLYSLHNHSKNIKLFDTSNLKYFINLLYRREAGSYHRFSINGFFLYFADYFFVLLSKIKKSFSGATQ